MKKSAVLSFLAVVPALCLGQSAKTQVATQALAPEVVLLRTHADLTPRELGLSPTGQLSVQVFNRGDVGVKDTVKIDFFVSNAPLGSTTLRAVGGKQSITVTQAVNTAFPCDGREVKVVIDAANQIQELHDDNNSATATLKFPCPDLAIKSIEKNWNDWKTEYVARVTIVNQGHVTVQQFMYLATTGGASFAQLADYSESQKGPLAPGETTKFNIGHAFAGQNLRVLVWVDRHNTVREIDENNNMKEKTLD